MPKISRSCAHNLHVVDLALPLAADIDGELPLVVAGSAHSVLTANNCGMNPFLQLLQLCFKEGHVLS